MISRLARLLKTPSRAARDDEAGFSIVELLASLTILAIGVVSLLGTLVVAAKAAGTQRGRTNAVFAANQAIENVRSRAYDDIAIWDDDPDMAISPTTSSPNSGPVRTEFQDHSIPIRPEPMVFAGVTYEILQNVLWVPVEETINGQLRYYERAYKLLVVRVNWRDQVGPHSIQVESAIYPGGLGEQPVSCTNDGLLIQPGVDGVDVTATMPVESTPGVLVGWRDRADNECKYVLEVLVLPYEPLLCRGAGIEPQWIEVAELEANASSYMYAGTWDRWYCFRVRAVNKSNEAQEEGVPATDWVYSNPVGTPLPPTTECLLVGPFVRSPAMGTTTNRIQIHPSTGFNTNDMIAAVDVQGNCTQVWAEFVNKDGQLVSTGYLTQASPWWVYLPSNWERFSLGYGTVYFYAIGDLHDASNPAQAVLTVCYYKGGGGKPSC